jgi:four helix bundle protein
MEKGGGSEGTGVQDMGRVGQDFLERIEQAVDRTIQMALALPRNVAGVEIGRQVIRSAGSVGANLEEAQATITKKDFLHKVSLSLREGRETLYWIRRIERNGLLPPNRLAELMREWNEIVAMLTTVVKKLRR